MAKKQHTKPCAGCPFKRSCLPGWLGEASPQEFINSSLADVRLPCHSAVDYQKRDWELQSMTAPECAGNAIFLANIAKRPVAPDRLKTPKISRDTKTVFATRAEFLEHHENPTAVLAKRGPPKASEHPAEGPCFECGTKQDGDSWCFGCKSFICEACGVNWNMPLGGHTRDTHLEEPDSEEY